MLHGKPPVSARYMIERRCLIRGYGSTGSFPGDFAELENGFVSPSAGVGLPDRPHFAESDFSWALKFHPLRVEPVLARNVLLGRSWSMDQSEDPRELERKIEQASRIASTMTDQSTIERLRGWVEELRQGLRQRLAERRAKEEIKTRARELWEQNGCPAGRDLEFWLQAESEIKSRELQV